MRAEFRALSGNPSRELCIAALGKDNAPAHETMLVRITGGRTIPATIVVSPGTRLSFQNRDPFPHRIYQVGNQAWKAENQETARSREWTAPPGAGRYEFRDELFPSVRTFVVVEPQVLDDHLPRARRGLRVPEPPRRRLRPQGLLQRQAGGSTGERRLEGEAPRRHQGTAQRGRDGRREAPAMMILSRIWYIVLSILTGIALYVVFLAVGQYNRRNTAATTEELASDSQTVGWALQIDARKRLDALLIGSVDKGVQDALQVANTKDAIPAKTKEDGRRALVSVLDKIPADFKPDALFAVDHEGRVVAQVGYDVANPLTDFELGGYPVVFDAIHGFLRDDTWVLGGKLYRMAARPVEFDATQPPLGAIVAMRQIDKKFAQDLSKHTRASVTFYAGGQRVASAAAEGFDESQLGLVDGDLPKLEGDKEYTEGRSAVRWVNETVGVMYARLFGDAWPLGAGFAVARARVTIPDWLGFLKGADDTDTHNVNFGLIGGVVFLGILGGMLLSLLEHSMPMAEMRRQAVRLKKGDIDYFQLPRFRGGFRPIAQDVNAGIRARAREGWGRCPQAGRPGVDPGAGAAAAGHERLLVPAPRRPAGPASAAHAAGTARACRSGRRAAGAVFAGRKLSRALRRQHGPERRGRRDGDGGGGNGDGRRRLATGAASSEARSAHRGTANPGSWRGGPGRIPSDESLDADALRRRGPTGRRPGLVSPLDVPRRRGRPYARGRRAPAKECASPRTCRRGHHGRGGRATRRAAPGGRRDVPPDDAHRFPASGSPRAGVAPAGRAGPGGSARDRLFAGRRPVGVEQPAPAAGDDR